MKKKMLMVLSVVAAVSMTGLTGCGGSSKSITIGTQTYTEPKIIAEMYKALIEDQTDVKVKIKTDLASSPVVIKAMQKDEVQMATLYSGEIYNNYFQLPEQTKDRQKVLQIAKDGFKKTFNFKWYDGYGFENTYAFTVRQDVADKYKLSKISDVAAIAKDMKLGVDTTWLERANDGYKAFTKQYGFEFGKTFPMEIGLVYDAVSNKDVDIVLAYSTDGRIKQFNLKTLEDDKHFFPPYDACPVIKEETLKKYPELDKVVSELSGKIDAAAMTEMNFEVDVNKKDPRDVALDFLKKQGLLK